MPAQTDLPVSCQHTRRIGGSFNQHIAYELQVVILLARLTKEGARDNTIDIGIRPALPLLLSNRIA